MMRILAASLILAALAAAPVQAGERTVRSGAAAPCADTSVGRTVCGAQTRETTSGELPSADVPADLQVEPGFFGAGQAGGVGDEPAAYVGRGRVVVVVAGRARASASARVRVGARAGGCACR